MASAGIPIRRYRTPRFGWAVTERYVWLAAAVARRRGWRVRLTCGAPGDAGAFFCETYRVSSRSPGSMKSIFAAVRPVLAQSGYRRSGSTFVKMAEPDRLGHVVNFQRGGFIQEVPGELDVAPGPHGGSPSISVCGCPVCGSTCGHLRKVP
jgi:hypothetical protein